MSKNDNDEKANPRFLYLHLRRISERARERKGIKQVKYNAIQEQKNFRMHIRHYRKEEEEEEKKTKTARLRGEKNECVHMFIQNNG